MVATCRRVTGGGNRTRRIGWLIPLRHPSPTEKGTELIQVLVPCTIPAQHQEQALKVYRELIEATRREAGCRSYDLHREMDDETRFMLIEEWDSQEHLDAHTQTEHFVRLVGELEKLEYAEPAVRLTKLI